MNDNSYHINTKLLQDFSPETVIDGTKKLKAITTDREMVFLIGSDDMLRVVYQDSGSESGWSTKTISLPKEVVSSFDIYIGPESKSAVLGYSSNIEGESIFRISPVYQDLQTSPLIESIDLSEFNLITLPSEQSVQNIVVSPNASFLTVSVKNSDAMYYAVSGNDELVPYSLPDNAKSIDSMSIGHWMYDLGVFLLYKVNGKQQLIFKSFPDKEYGQGYTTEFSIGNFEVLSMETNYSNGNSILVCSGVGIKIFENTLEPSIEYTHPDGFNISNFDFVKADGEISLLYSCELFSGNHQMFEVSTSDNGETWSDATLLGSDIANFTMTGNSKDLSLYCVGTDLTTLQRINRNQFWTQELVSIEVLGKLKEFYSFNSLVHLDDYSGDHIKISSSRLVRVIINSVPYVLSPEYFTTVPMDGLSTLDIVQELDSVLSCFLFIKVDGFQNEICIDLSKPLCEKFETLNSVSSILDDPKLAGAIKSQKIKKDGSISNCVEAIQDLLKGRERLKNEMIEDRLKQQELIQGLFVISAAIGTYFAALGAATLFGSMFFRSGTPIPDYFNANVDTGDDGDLSVTFEIDGVLSKPIHLKTPDEVTLMIGIMLGQLGVTPNVLAEWAGIPVDFNKVRSLFSLISSGIDNLIDGFNKEFTKDKIQEMIDKLITPVLPPDTDIPIPVMPPVEDDPDEDGMPKPRLSCENPISRWFMSRLLRYSAPYILQQIKNHLSKTSFNPIQDYISEVDTNLEEMQPMFDKFETLFGKESLDFNEFEKYCTDNKVVENLTPVLISMNNQELLNIFVTSSLNLDLNGIPFLSEIYSQKIADDETSEISVKDTISLYLGFTGVSFLSVEEESEDNKENGYDFNTLDGYALGNSLLVMLRACITFKSSRLKVMAVNAELNPPKLNQLITDAGMGLFIDFLIRMFGSLLNYNILLHKGEPVMPLKFFYVYYTIFSGFIALCWSMMYATNNSTGDQEHQFFNANSFRNLAGKTRKMTGIAGIFNFFQIIEWLAHGPKPSSPYASSLLTMSFQLSAWKKPTQKIIKYRGYLLASVGTALFVESLYGPAVRKPK